MALCDILSSGIFQIFIYLAILAYFIQSCYAKRTKTQRQNLQIKWNAIGKDVVILHQFPRARFCPSPSPYPIKLETFLRMHNIKVISIRFGCNMLTFFYMFVTNYLTTKLHNFGPNL